MRALLIPHVRNTTSVYNSHRSHNSMQHMCIYARRLRAHHIDSRGGYESTTHDVIIIIITTIVPYPPRRCFSHSERGRVSRGSHRHRVGEAVGAQNSESGEEKGAGGGIEGAGRG